MTVFAVFDGTTGRIILEALVEYVAEWHRAPGRMIAIIGPDRSIVGLWAGAAEYERHRTMLNNLVQHAATFGIEIREDYLYGADGCKEWFHNGSFIGRYDPLDGWDILGKVEPMSSIFCICNVITGKCTSTAPTPELIERVYHAGWAGKRGPEQVIAEFPISLGITVENFSLFPKKIIFDGVALYGRRKAGKL